jgi:threonine/homoserine/homoserine lactone efflux protein
MFGIHDYWLFLATGILLNLTPGQDSLFIIGRSLTGGVRCGIAAALGVSAGSVVHTLAAALGLSAILAASATAFSVVKLAGAAYLVHLGIKLLRAGTLSPAAGLPGTPAAGGSAPAACFRQGMLTNLLNPKVALFFLALLPQFIEPTSASRTVAFLILGASFITTGTLWCVVLVTAAARLRGLLTRKPQVRTLIERATGTLFLLLGARLAWSR